MLPEYRQVMRAIIIGAGRGRRLMPTTADTPKCYAEIQGRRVLDWALRAFAGAGVSDICFIGGYQIERVRRDYPHFTFRHNTGWEHNNIMRWLERYEHRTQHPPDDAEKVTVLNGCVTRVHRAIAPREAHGEYTGIAKFTPKG